MTTKNTNREDSVVTAVADVIDFEQPRASRANLVN